MPTRMEKEIIEPGNPDPRVIFKHQTSTLLRSKLGMTRGL